MNFRIIIQAVIKSFEWSTDKRTGENLNNAFPYYIYLYTIVNKWALINFFYLHGGRIFEVGRLIKREEYVITTPEICIW